MLLEADELEDDLEDEEDDYFLQELLEYEAEQERVRMAREAAHRRVMKKEDRRAG